MSTTEQPHFYVVLGVKDLTANRLFWEALGFSVNAEFPQQIAMRQNGYEVLLDATGEYPPASQFEIGISVTRETMMERLERLKAMNVKPFR